MPSNGQSRGINYAIGGPFSTKIQPLLDRNIVNKASWWVLM